MRYIRRVCILLAFIETVFAMMVIVGGPCSMAGGRDRTGGGYIANNNPTSLSERLEFVTMMSLGLALIFPLFIPARRK